MFGGRMKLSLSSSFFDGGAVISGGFTSCVGVDGDGASTCDSCFGDSGLGSGCSDFGDSCFGDSGLGDCCFGVSGLGSFGSEGSDVLGVSSFGLGCCGSGDSSGFGLDGSSNSGFGRLGVGFGDGLDSPSPPPPPPPPAHLSLLQSTGRVITGKHSLEDFWFGLF
ncbi:hypothetical protein N665_1170s0004, partial [Sinapis alba]